MAKEKVDGLFSLFWSNELHVFDTFTHCVSHVFDMLHYVPKISPL